MVEGAEMDARALGSRGRAPALASCPLLTVVSARWFIVAGERTRSCRGGAAGHGYCLRCVCRNRPLDT